MVFCRRLVGHIHASMAWAVLWWVERSRGEGRGGGKLPIWQETTALPVCPVLPRKFALCKPQWIPLSWARPPCAWTSVHLGADCLPRGLRFASAFGTANDISEWQPALGGVALPWGFRPAAWTHSQPWVGQSGEALTSLSVLPQAATLIQSVFRGSQARRAIKRVTTEAAAAIAIQSAWSSHRERQKTLGRIMEVCLRVCAPQLGHTGGEQA